LAAVFLRAAGLRAAVFFLAAVFLAAAMPPPLSLLVVMERFDRNRGGRSSGRHALQASAFPFTHASPHPVSLIAA
jgi:hypothetical protein